MTRHSSRRITPRWLEATLWIVLLAGGVLVGTVAFWGAV